MEGEIWIINTPEALENCIHTLRQSYKKTGVITVKMELDQRRSLKQNNALQLYCRWLANDLNDAGLDMLKVLTPGAKIPWTGNTARELLWRKVQEAMTGKTSTTKPQKAEYVEIYRALSHHIAITFNVNTPWPGSQ